MKQTLALNRFGLGGRPDQAPPAQPERWLLDQFERYEPRPAAWRGIADRAEVAADLAGYIGRLRGAPEDGRGGRRNRAAGDPAPRDNAASAERRQALLRDVRKEERGHYVAAVGARANSALTTPTPFVERMVHFWANHFAISGEKRMVGGFAGSFELEAIRPHVLGRFADMLLAVEQHPAMLIYLDQTLSIGPDSEAGKRSRGKRNAGLNENLAREILELHTLGVNSGYSQEDVTEFARVLTGWTVGQLVQGPAARLVGTEGEIGAFRFAPQIHQPGTRTLLGKRYDQQGVAQGQAVLYDLAVHPATAKHIATKLARHFADDTPPPTMVDCLTTAFLSSGGDLPTVYRALIASPEAWQAGTKFKSPWDWTISAWRALGTTQLKGQTVSSLLNQLSQPVWRPGSPAGYDDITAQWAGPDALIRRVDTAERLVARAVELGDSPVDTQALMPDGLSRTSLQAIEQADSPAQARALLIVTPEFLRR